jgi:hypothetical protein
MLQDDSAALGLNDTVSTEEEATGAINLGPKYEANYPAPLMTKK